MKKISQILMAAVLTVGLVSFGGNVANAQVVEEETCESIVISNTGPGSINEGVCVVNIDVEVTCNNNVYVLNENDQEAVTGAAQELGNTTGGTAISGNATNENGTTVQIGAACGETTTPETPVTPTTPEKPVTPSTPTTPAAAPAQKVAALPNTASNQTVAIALIGFVVAALAVIASRIAIAAYRRSTLK
jgi:hypothetical protein